MNSNFFCILPWKQLRLNQDGKVYPCCRVSEFSNLGTLAQNSIEEIWNGAPIQELRRQFLAGEIPKTCRGCLDVEKSGGLSLRQEMSAKFPIDEETAVALSKNQVSTNSLISLDLRFSNQCNFSCRTCHPDYSTAWHGDAVKMGHTDLHIYNLNQDFPNLLSEIHKLAPQLQRIYFAGGEPFLQPLHYDLLNYLDQNQFHKIELSYNTNLSVLNLGRRNVFDFWKRFERVSVCLSFDGLEDKAEYLRKGTSWSKILKNLKALQELKPAVRITLAPTLSVYNCFHVPEILIWAMENRILNSTEDMSINYLSQPNYLSLAVLNEDERYRLVKSYKNRAPAYQAVLEKEVLRLQHYLASTPFDLSLRKKFKTFSLKLDRIRNEKLLQIFPELWSLYTEEKVAQL